MAEWTANKFAIKTGAVATGKQKSVSTAWGEDGSGFLNNDVVTFPKAAGIAGQIITDLAGNGTFTLETPAIVSVAGKTGTVTLVSGDVSLENVSNNAQIIKSIGTIKGDIIVYTGSNTPVRLGIGSDGQVPTADAAEASGIKWVTPSSGGVPGGVDTEVQYNNGGSFGGMDGMTYNDSTRKIIMNAGSLAGGDFQWNWDTGVGIFGDATDGFVGINTNNPTVGLDVFGDVRFTTSSLIDRILKVEAEGNAIIELFADTTSAGAAGGNDRDTLIRHFISGEATATWTVGLDKGTGIFSWNNASNTIKATPEMTLNGGGDLTLDGEFVAKKLIDCVDTGSTTSILRSQSTTRAAAIQIRANTSNSGTDRDSSIGWRIRGTINFAMGILDSDANDALFIGGNAGLLAAPIMRFEDTTFDVSVQKGNFDISATGKSLGIKEGAVTDSVGSATLVAGTVTIANTNIKTGDIIILTRFTAGGTLGFLDYTISDSTSFTINSANSSDTSVVNYFIIRTL